MSHIKNAQEKIYNEALLLIPQLGMSNKMLEQASVNADFEPLYSYTIFKNKIADFAIYMIEQLDKKMPDKLSKSDLSTLKVRERIFICVKTRLEIAAENKEAYRCLYHYLLQPSLLNRAAKCSWESSNLIWQMSGDNSVDFNYYTKRLLLMGVQSSTNLYWLQDNSKNHSDTWEFLERRINNVLQLGKLKFFAKKAA